MPNPPIPAAGEAMPSTPKETAEALAVAFVLACWLAGHRAYVEKSGRFGIALGDHPRLRPEPAHHLGPDRVYMLGFDERPFEALFARDDHLALLIEAAREVEARLAASAKGATP